MSAIETLPADLLGAAVALLRGVDAMTLVNASPTVMLSIAETIEPWQQGEVFAVKLWDLGDPAEVALLQARNDFLTKVAEVSGDPWDFVIRCRRDFQVSYVDVFETLMNVSAIECEQHNINLADDCLPRFVTLPRLKRLELNFYCRDRRDDVLTRVSRAPNLEMLKLVASGWSMSDSLTASLASMTHLRVLDLSGRIALGDAALRQMPELPTLTELRIVGCDSFTDVGVEQIVKKATNIKALRIPDDFVSAAARLTNEAVSHIVAGLPNLEHLDLTFHDRIDDAGATQLRHLQNLMDLSLHGWTKLTDQGFEGIATLPKLTALNVFGCQMLTDAGLSKLTSVTTLRSLSIGGTALTDDGLSLISSSLHVEELDVSRCSAITDVGVESITKLKHTLSSLSLELCIKVSDKGVHALAALTALTGLDLGGLKRITDDSLASVGKLRKLEHLMLSGCVSITGTGLVHLRSLSRLLTLDLLCCNLCGDATLSFLPYCTELTKLDVHHTKGINDDSVGNIAQCRYLEELILMGCNRVTDVGLRHLSNARCLTKLDLTSLTAITIDGIACLADVPLVHCEVSGSNAFIDAAKRSLKCLQSE